MRVDQLKAARIRCKNVFPLERGVTGGFEVREGCAKLREKNSCFNGRMSVAAEILVSRVGQIAVEIAAGRERVYRVHFEFRFLEQCRSVAK